MPEDYALRLDRVFTELNTLLEDIAEDNDVYLSIGIEPDSFPVRWYYRLHTIHATNKRNKQAWRVMFREGAVVDSEEGVGEKDD